LRTDRGRDGIDHINIFSRGETELGRLLSNFTTPSDLEWIETDHGRFKTIEGYWFWLGTEDETLRTMSGTEAKAYSKRTKKKIHRPKFQEHIKQAILNKILGSRKLKKMLTESTLDFDHYYVFKGVVKDVGYGWLVDWITEVRYLLKCGRFS
jgi:hypothetical protein